MFARNIIQVAFNVVVPAIITYAMSLQHTILYFSLLALLGAYASYRFSGGHRLTSIYAAYTLAAVIALIIVILGGLGKTYETAISATLLPVSCSVVSIAWKRSQIGG